MSTNRLFTKDVQYLNIKSPLLPKLVPGNLLVDTYLRAVFENNNSKCKKETYSEIVKVNVREKVSIIIDNITSDNIIDLVESKSKIHIKGNVTQGFKAGDKVFLRVNNETYRDSVKVDVSFVIKLLGSDLASDNKVVASTMCSSKFEKKYDVKTLDLNINIDNVTSDNIINAHEAQLNIPIYGKITGKFKKDDIVVLRVNGIDYTAKLKKREGLQVL